MGHPNIIHDGLVSAKEMADILGVPVSRVKTIEQAQMPKTFIKGITRTPVMKVLEPFSRRLSHEAKSCLPRLAVGSGSKDPLQSTLDSQNDAVTGPTHR